MPHEPPLRRMPLLHLELGGPRPRRRQPRLQLVSVTPREPPCQEASHPRCRDASLQEAGPHSCMARGAWDPPAAASTPAPRKVPSRGRGGRSRASAPLSSSPGAPLQGRRLPEQAPASASVSPALHPPLKAGLLALSPAGHRGAGCVRAPEARGCPPPGPPLPAPGGPPEDLRSFPAAPP